MGFFPNELDIEGFDGPSGRVYGQSSSGGPPNGGYLLTDGTRVPFHRDLGFTVAPCGLRDLSTATRDPNAIDLMLNCGTAEAIQFDCFQGMRRNNPNFTEPNPPFGLTADRRDVVDNATGADIGCFETFHEAETDTSWFTPKVALEYQPKDHLLFYLSWARGEKPGGFNTVPFGSRGFEPANDLFEAEVMDVTEFGYKTAWFGNTLTVNGAFFFQDYTDKQVNTQIVVPDPTDPGSFNTSPKTINAGGAEVPGLELDVFWAPAFEVVGGNLQLSLSYTWLDSEYTDFALPTTGGTDVYVVNNCTADPDLLVIESTIPTLPDIVEPVPQCIVDRSGNDLEDSPDNSAVISGRYEHPFFGGGSEWYFEFDTTYRDKTWLEDANAAQVDEWWNTNFRLGWQNERMEAVFFVNNVFDDTTFQSGFTTPGLASSFIFAHTRDMELPFPPAATARDCCNSGTRSIGRSGPEFNSAVVVATMRPPRHWGVRFAMKFGGG